MVFICLYISDIYSGVIFLLLEIHSLKFLLLNLQLSSFLLLKFFSRNIFFNLCGYISFVFECSIPGCDKHYWFSPYLHFFLLQGCRRLILSLAEAYYCGSGWGNKSISVWYLYVVRNSEKHLVMYNKETYFKGRKGHDSFLQWQNIEWNCVLHRSPSMWIMLEKSLDNRL